MKPSLRVRVATFTILREIEGAWGPSDLRAVMNAAGLEDTDGFDDSELHEMCVLALQELGPTDAAVAVVTQRVGAQLRAGQIRNLAEESQDEKLWEHYADMSLHERLFEAGSLLHTVFPRVFPQPDAVRVCVEVAANNTPAKEILDRPLHESFLVRLLADGMDDSSPLLRLFGEQLAGDAFAEADNIVWTALSNKDGPHSVAVEITSSGFWLDPLRDTRSYESSAHPDARIFPA